MEPLANGFYLRESLGFWVLTESALNSQGASRSESQLETGFKRALSVEGSWESPEHIRLELTHQDFGH